MEEMKSQIEIVKDISDGMIGIGGIPTNEEFYREFDMRVRASLRIHDVVGQCEQYHCELYDFGRKDSPCDKQCDGCKSMNLD